MAEYILGQTPRGFLPDAFKYHVPQIVEQHAAKTRASVSRDQCDGDRHAVFHARNHPVNSPAVHPRHAELDEFRDNHQQQGKDDAYAQASLILRP